MVMKYIMCGYSNVDFTIYGVLQIKVSLNSEANYD